MSELKEFLLTKDELVFELSRFHTYLDKVIRDDAQTNQLKRRLEKIQGSLNEYASLHLKTKLLDPTNREKYDQELVEFEDLHFYLTSTASDLLETSKPTPATHKYESNSFTNSINLPQIDLPTFSGDVNEWLEFNDTFTSLIDSNNNLSNVQKFYYLKSCLKGDAEAVIHSLKVSNDNYSIAWKLLKERYQNDKLIVNSHVRSLFDLPSISKESSSSLRKLLDDVKRILRVLESFKQPVDKWDLLLIHLLSGKLDFQTRKAWESVNVSPRLPTMSEFLKFLNDRCSLLEAINNTACEIKSKPERVHNKQGFKSFISTNKSRSNCQLCHEDHLLYFCRKFLELPISQRRKEVKSLRLCFNCLKPSHRVDSCTSVSCKSCGQRHNSLLHIDEQVEQRVRVLQQLELGDHNEVEPKNNKTTLVSIMSLSHSNEILLATAIVDLVDSKGNLVQARALLDSGSQSNLMTSELANRLRLTRERVNIPVIGINQGCVNIKEMTKTKLKSRVNSYQIDVTFLILKKIADNMPTSKANFIAPPNIRLADHRFYEPGKIDILLGASLFYDLMCIGQIKGKANEPIIQKTKLGWIVSGNTERGAVTQQKRRCNLVRDVNFELQKFWELEEGPGETHLSQEEEACQKEFLEQFSQDESGRFTVPLMFKGDIDDLGTTYDVALRRFKQLERKFAKDDYFRHQYVSFMEEYKTLGHMVLVEEADHADKIINYLPHHGVIKEDSTTTKLRVVFDGSCASSTGISLNERLKVGPTIQQDLFSILVRFRKHNVVITADIEKMYRQVMVQESHQDLQRILWRSNVNEEICKFKLLTVTYGTSIASYLAIRCLHQIGLEAAKFDPDLGRIIIKDFYVDDLLTGSHTIEGAVQLKNKIQETLEKGCFNLRKWASNRQEVISSDEISNNEHSLCDDGSKKTLGLIWNSKLDILHFTIERAPTERRVTKRKILSTMSKTFDPLGLVGPCIIKAKLIMQNLWRLNLSWDESVPYDIHTEWLQFQANFASLDNIKIPRQIISPDATKLEIHGFCDASERAYGACVYARSTNFSGEHSVQLICAKSKVSPLKCISLPKLELCGAVLLARLVETVTRALDIDIAKTTYWCDSQIVLAWISGEPCKWKVFVANRVAEIQQSSRSSQWRHVAGKDNPADIISRGPEPDKLSNSTLWWNAAPWLTEDEEVWPEHNFTEIHNIPEQKEKFVHLVMPRKQSGIFDTFSSITKLQRVQAYVFRFINNCKRQIKSTGFLTVKELNRSMLHLTKLAQTEVFYEEIDALSQRKEIPRHSKILSLNPFLDDDGVLRVGGRLGNSGDLQFSQKFPIILPQRHKFTEMIIQAMHYKNLHAGPLALLAIMRQTYWPIAGKYTIKSVLKRCIVCFRAKPLTMHQLMGNLPKERITASRPFLYCGTDFAGPFNIRANKLKNTKVIKVYLCIFICFATKAAHLELVSDMSSDAFLNCLKRFISRRGKPVKIFSDNGTNFIGANSSLKEFLKFLSKENETIGSALASESIMWSFIPGRSPHQGGIWESAVKSAKFHLYRVINVNFTPTYETFHTIVTQIEACLNSRPLTPISSDPQDFHALTPGHFLIGAPLTAIPEPNLEETKINRLNHYQQAAQTLQRFWSRWSIEYISTLQERTKWKTRCHEELKEGALVLLKEDNLSPLKWKMGRVLKLFPGSDGLTRVVLVKTQNGEVMRSIQKMCLLPVEDAI